MIKKGYLGNYTELISSGSTPKGGSDNYLDHGEILFIRSQNVLMNQFSDHDALYIPVYIHKKMKRTWVKNRDVLLNITGASIGRTTVYVGEDNKANVNQHVCIIRLKDFKTIDPFYLSYFLSSPSFQRHMMKINAGATRQALNFSQISKFKIPIPPIQTQKKIVEIVKKAEKLKKWRAEADELADVYLKSVFLEMFGDPSRNPNGWEQKTLGESCHTIKDGPHVSPKYVEDGIPFISVNNIIKGYWDLENVRYVSYEDHQKFTKKCKPEKGDVLYTKGGTTGFAKYIDIDLEFSNWVHLAVLKFDKKEINGIFLEHMLNSDYCYQQSQLFTRGIANRDLVINQMKRIKIVIPYLELQNQFANIVQQVEILKSHQSQSKREIDNLFNTLMQKTFKGELVC